MDAPPPALELTTFPKWLKIPKELRKHAMSYFDGQSLYNYSTCSKLCNIETRKLDWHDRYSIEISGDGYYDVGVELQFENRHGRRKTVNAIFKKENSHIRDSNFYSFKMFSRGSGRDFNRGNQQLEPYSGNFLDAAVTYLENELQHHWRPFDFNLVLTLQQWPTQFTNIFERFRGCEWKTHMNKEIYEPFKNLMMNHSPRGCLRFTRSDSGSMYPYKMPNDYFDTPLFQNTRRFRCGVRTLMTDDQFINANCDELNLQSGAINPEAVHKKIKRILEENSTRFAKFVIRNYEPTTIYYNDKELKSFYSDRLKTIFGDLPFKEGEERGTWLLEKPDGSIARIWCMNYGVSFELNATRYL